MKKVVFFSLIGLLLAHETRAEWTRPETKSVPAKVLKLGSRKGGASEEPKGPPQKPLPVPQKPLPTRPVKTDKAGNATKASASQLNTNPYISFVNLQKGPLQTEWNNLQKALLAMKASIPKETKLTITSSVNQLKPELDALMKLGEALYTRGATQDDIAIAQGISTRASNWVGSAVFASDSFRTGIPALAKHFAAELRGIANEIVDFYTKK
jgi:hypothetical protein